MRLNQIGRRSWRYARIILSALLTPLLEKNPSKTMTFSRCYVPMVLSMARVVVLLFAMAMLRQVERAGVTGWPEATLCIAVVLALPLMGALDRVKPEQTIGLMKALFRRLGEGAARQVRGVYAAEPTKLDDIRDDESAELTVAQSGTRRFSDRGSRAA